MRNRRGGDYRHTAINNTMSRVVSSFQGGGITNNHMISITSSRGVSDLLPSPLFDFFLQNVDRLHEIFQLPIQLGALLLVRLELITELLVLSLNLFEFRSNNVHH